MGKDMHVESMTQPKILDELHRIFRDGLQIEVPSASSNLIEGGLLDSLGFVELVLQLEATFGISVELDSVDFDHFQSVNSIAEFVARELRSV